MSATDEFAEFHARRNAERAAAVKVTWRKVSEFTGGGYSGLGPGGKLVYVVKDAWEPLWRFGRVLHGERVQVGIRPTLAQAKRDAARLLEG